MDKSSRKCSLMIVLKLEIKRRLTYHFTVSHEEVYAFDLLSILTVLFFLMRASVLITDSTITVSCFED